MRAPALLALALLPACGPAPAPVPPPAGTATGEAPHALTAGGYVTKGPVIAGVTAKDAWVSWETVERRGQGCGDGPPKLVLTAAGKAPATSEDAACGTAHHVHLTNLSPGTAYSFSLDHGNGHGPPVEGRFSTASADRDAAFRFVVYGDDRDDNPGKRSTRPDHESVVAAIMNRDSDAAFLVQTGDLALNRPPGTGYQAFFEDERPLLASHALYPAVGNHEKLDTTIFDALVNAPSFAGAPHPYYGSYDWGGVHLVLLDTFEAPKAQPLLGPEQLRWFDADLAAAEQAGQLIFVFTHQGPYSHCPKVGGCHGGLPADKGGGGLLRALVAHHVPAIFAGHDHYYQHGREGEGCVNYFVVGGGGAPMYDPVHEGVSDAPGVIKSRKVNSYVTVTVKGRTATFEAKGVDGAVVDSGVLAPMATGACPPSVPERASADPAAD